MEKLLLKRLVLVHDAVSGWQCQWCQELPFLAFCTQLALWVGRRARTGYMAIAQHWWVFWRWRWLLSLGASSHYHDNNYNDEENYSYDNPDDIQYAGSAGSLGRSLHVTCPSCILYSERKDESSYSKREAATQQVKDRQGKVSRDISLSCLHLQKLPV